MIVNNLYIIWVFIFIMAILYMTRVIWFYVETVKANDENIKFKLSKPELLLTWLAATYFVTYIIWLI